MLKRIAIIVLLGSLGFSVGYVSTWLGGHRYFIGTTLWLPRHSAHSPAELVAMTSGRHPGAQVQACGGNKICIEATGTILSADEAMSAAYRGVVNANDGKFQFQPYYAYFADQQELTWGDPVRRGLVGLLAGLSVALGFLVPPPKARVLRCASCSDAVQRPKPAIAMSITLGIVGGFAVAATLLILAACLFAMYSRQPV